MADGDPSLGAGNAGVHTLNATAETDHAGGLEARRRQNVPSVANTVTVFHHKKLIVVVHHPLLLGAGDSHEEEIGGIV